MRPFAAIALILAVISTLGTAAQGFEVSPTNPSPGDSITLTGTGSPGERITFRSSFTMDLPVRDGGYEYETSVQIPSEPNRFLVTAKNVQDLTAGVKMGIWITRRFEASSGVASISQSGVPTGRYDLKIFGKSLPGSSLIPVEVVAETGVTPDSKGKYVLVIDTTGVPAGKYRIEAAGETKTILIGDSGDTPQSGGESAAGGDLAGSESQDSEQSAGKLAVGKVEIGPEVVRWYANLTGQTVENSSQYAAVQRLLEKRLSGGYWKVIARGDPLTESAGYCQQQYCLVRGVDACRVCRDKEMIGAQNASRERSPLEENKSAPGAPALDGSRSSDGGQEKGYIRMITDWIWELFGRATRG